MKIIVFISIALGLPIKSKAQIDTLRANATHNLVLFFPSPIRQAVTGSGNFTFSYNRDETQYFGLLQANPGTDSNLLVLTQDGRAYSYGIQYRKQLPETYRFIGISESIGNEIPKSTVTEKAIKEYTSNNMDTKGGKSLHYRVENFRKFSAYHYGHNNNSLKSKRKEGIVLRVKDLVYDRTEVYAVMEIENRSKINFEVDVLEIYRVNGNKRRKSSYQKVEMLPIYKHKFPDMVKVRESRKFVYVLPKFTLGDADKLLFSFKEKRGSRMSELRMGKY